MSNDFDNEENGSAEDDSFEVDLPPEKELLKAGVYPATVIGYEKGISKSSGSPQLTWTFRVPAAEGELKSWTPLGETAVWKLNEYVVALGLGQPGTKVTLSKRVIIGRRCMVKIAHDEYNGKKVLKIQSIKPHPNGPVVPEGEELPF
jgi:hypothetical protein